MFKLNGTCMRCGVLMRRHMELGCAVYKCRLCERVAIVGGDVICANVVEARLFADGYRRN